MNRIEEIDQAIEKLRAEKAAIQEECCHPLLVRKTENKSDSGGWDTHVNYWKNHHCGFCDKRWTEDC